MCTPVSLVSVESNAIAVESNAIATMSGRIIKIETRVCVQRRSDTCGSAACRHQQPTQITPAAAAAGASNSDTLCTVVILIWEPIFFCLNESRK